MNNHVANFVLRSAFNHVFYILPASSRSPKLYSGKAETLLLTLALDLLDTELAKLPQRDQLIRSSAAFNLYWRCLDEVVDEKLITIAQINADDLEKTIVFHKHSGEFTSALDSLQLLQLEARDSYPQIEPLAHQYRDEIVRVSNDSLFHVWPVLPYPLAIKTKMAITGLLGEIGANLVMILLHKDEPLIADLFRQAILAMQFGDDLFDWRRDWQDYSAKSSQTFAPARPIENLLLSTLSEFPTEWAACEKILLNNNQDSYQWLRDLAPKAYQAYSARFLTQVASLPAHPKTEFVKDLLKQTFFTYLPLLPESGWFSRWGRY